MIALSSPPANYEHCSVLFVSVFTLSGFLPFTYERLLYNGVHTQLR